MNASTRLTWRKVSPMVRGHLVVDLDDDVAGALRRRQRGVDGRAEAHVAVGVGRRALQQADVDRDRPGA